MIRYPPIKYVLALAALALFAHSPSTLAHKQEVHSTITRQAAVSSQNLKRFCADALQVDMWANMPKFKYDARNLTIFGWSELGKSAWRSGWLDKGSYDEDEPWYLPVRTENHFYTPVPRSRLTKGLTDPPVDVGVHDSFNWASVSRDVNSESWPKARSYELDGLTNPSSTARNASLGHMFYALGHVLHLNQDTTSPPHTRDDNHLPGWLGGPGVSFFEEYGEGTYLRHGRRFSDDSGFPLSATEWSDWLAAGFTSLESFWDRNLYSGQPEVLDGNETGQGSANQLGLAEYCNGNFLSRHALYPEVPGLTPRHVFPYPSIFDTDFETKFSGAPYGYTPQPQTDELMLNRIFLDKVAHGAKLKNHAVLSYLAVNKRKKTFPYGISIHDDSVLGAYYTNLMPKAVEYSAGILDYFFRGRLDVGAVQLAGQCQMHITNRSGQTLSSGALTLYQDDAGGNRTPVSLTVPWTDSSTLADGAALDGTVSGTFSGDTKLTLVYQGTIGVGAGSPPPALDSVDALIAIAAKSFQVLQLHPAWQAVWVIGAVTPDYSPYFGPPDPITPGFDIGDFCYLPFAAGEHWTQRLISLGPWGPTSPGGPTFPTYELHQSGSDPIAMNADGTWSATPMPWESYDWVFGIAGQVANGEGPGGGWALSCQVQGKILYTGPVKGTVIVYPDLPLGLYYPAPNIDPWPGDDLPTPLSYRYIDLAPGETFELLTDHLGRVDPEYGWTTAVAAFRYGAQPADFAWYPLH